MHEINGKRMNRYHELGQYAFGERAELLAICTAYLCGPDPVYTSAGKTAGLWAIIPFQLIVMIGLGRFH